MAVEGPHQNSGEGVHRRPPEVTARGGRRGLLTIGKLAVARRFEIMRFAPEDTRDGQNQEAGILCLTKPPPFEIIDMLEMLLQFHRPFQLSKLVKTEQRGMGADNERCEGRSSDLRERCQCFDVIGWMLWLGSQMKFVVSHKDSERLASGGVELVTVHFAEKDALIELDGPLEITYQLGPGRREDLDLYIRPNIHAACQLLQPFSMRPQAADKPDGAAPRRAGDSEDHQFG